LNVEEYLLNFICNWVCKGGGRRAPPNALSRTAPGLVRLRALGGAQDMALYIAAAKAARMRDLQAHVVTAEGKHRALWPCGTTQEIGTRGGLTMSYSQPGAPKGPHPIVRA